jgi:hypothetical protein
MKTAVYIIDVEGNDGTDGTVVTGLLCGRVFLLTLLAMTMLSSLATFYHFPTDMHS